MADETVPFPLLIYDLLLILGLTPLWKSRKKRDYGDIDDLI
jgi:hypothetical protein